MHCSFCSEEMEQRLPKEKLFALCELPAVRQYVLESDYAFYQALVQVLIPDVLRPIPGRIHHSQRVNIICQSRPTLHCENIFLVILAVC